MILFGYPPTKLFLELIERAYNDARANQKIVRNYTTWYFNELYTELMGGNEEIYSAIEKIIAVFKSREMYELSDYYDFVLGSVLYRYCHKYNSGKCRPLKLNGCVVEQLDYEELTNLYLITNIKEIEENEPDRGGFKKIVELKNIKKVKKYTKIEADSCCDYLWASGFGEFQEKASTELKKLENIREYFQ